MKKYIAVLEISIRHYDCNSDLDLVFYEKVVIKAENKDEAFKKALGYEYNRAIPVGIHLSEIYLSEEEVSK